MAELYSNACAYHIFFIHSFFRSIIISQYSQNHLFYQIQKFLTIARNRQSPHFSSKYLLVSLVYISHVLFVISGLFNLIFRNHFLGFSDINQCGKVVFLNSPIMKYLYVPKYLAAQSSEFKFILLYACVPACTYVHYVHIEVCRRKSEKALDPLEVYMDAGNRTSVLFKCSKYSQLLCSLSSPKDSNSTRCSLML